MIQNLHESWSWKITKPLRKMLDIFSSFIVQIKKILYRNSKKKKLLLITGCGRSGTTYICHLLRENDIVIGHETEGQDGTASWPMTILDAKNIPWGESAKDYKFHFIFHQVRNPIHTIASCLTLADSSWDFIKKYIPIKPSDSKLLMAMRYWYYWNLLAEKISSFTYRIEDIDITLPQIIKRVGKGKFNVGSLKNTSRKINTREHILITLKDLEKEDSILCNKIINLAKKYGYTDEELTQK